MQSTTEGAPPPADPRNYEKIRQVVGKLSLFQVLDELGWDRTARIARAQRFEVGGVVVAEGDVGDEFFVLLKGTARVTVDDMGEVKEVARISPGDFFGEMCIVGSSPGQQRRQATIEAVEPMVVLAFDGEPMRTLIADYPHLKELLTGVGLKRSEENIERLMSDL